MTPQERKNFEAIRDNVHGEQMTAEEQRLYDAGYTAGYMDCSKKLHEQSTEPVAWLCKRKDGFFDVLSDHTCIKCFPVYTHPQKATRQWVGLTDDEFNELYDRYVPQTCFALLIEKVEEKLKEKNT